MVENKIVAFHIGRGGRFNNQGFLRFLGEKKIGEFTDHLFDNYEGLRKLREAIGDRENLNEKFESCLDNNDFTFFEKLGFDLGEKVYFDCSGNEVGLTEKDVESGIGCIDEDGDYDSTYTCYLKDCGEDELKLILNDSGWVDGEILEFCREKLGINNYKEIFNFDDFEAYKEDFKYFMAYDGYRFFLYYGDFQKVCYNEDLEKYNSDSDKFMGCPIEEVEFIKTYID